MEILQIGLGSMGRRRVRCLHALTRAHIVGYDPREDRRAHASETLGVTSTAALTDAAWDAADAVVISSPPLTHGGYLQQAIDRDVPAFVEIGVPYPEYADIVTRAEARRARVAPSCTLRFHPAVRAIRSTVASMRFGRLTTFAYYLGQFLPDWHPWEPVSDFYVSTPETSGTREMATFEMTWLVDVVGMPSYGCALTARTPADIGAEIDHAYGFVLGFPDALGTVLVDVVARSALRQLVLNLERAEIRWSWDEQRVRVYDAVERAWEEIELPAPESAPGYDSRIGEAMYVDEMRAFLGLVAGHGAFPHSLPDDLLIRECVTRLEHDARDRAAKLRE